MLVNHLKKTAQSVTSLTEATEDIPKVTSALTADINSCLFQTKKGYMLNRDNTDG